MQRDSKLILIRCLATTGVPKFLYIEFSTYMMHYAHDSLLNSFHASHDDFVALPTNSGSTGAI